MKKYLSRKFLLSLALFVVTQVLKFQGKIGDTVWLLSSIGGIIGYAAILAYLAKKDIRNKEG
jgi:uncharacterized membrane protein